MPKSYKLSIPDLIVIEPDLFQDSRGFFYESYNKKIFDDIVGKKIDFVQDNHSKSSKGILRGLHYQKYPYEQGKLVRVISGEVFDVAVDLRPSSPYFGNIAYEYLSSVNKKQLWIPEGFAHGFLVMSKEVDFVYKTTKFYNPQSEITINWNDPDLNIPWPKTETFLSEKDINGISFSNFASELKNDL